MRFPDMKPPPVPHDCLMNGEGERWQIAGREEAQRAHLAALGEQELTAGVEDNYHNDTRTAVQAVASRRADQPLDARNLTLIERRRAVGAIAIGGITHVVAPPALSSVCFPVTGITQMATLGSRSAEPAQQARSGRRIRSSVVTANLALAHG